MKLLTIITATLLFISCGKNEPLTQIKDGSNHLVKKIGEIGEDLGQIPRQIGNKLLGTNEDTDENLEELENKVDNNYDAMLQLIKKLSTEIESVDSKVDINNNSLVASLQEQYDELIQIIEQGDSTNEALIIETNRKLRDLKRKVNRIKRRLSYYRTVLRGFYRRVSNLEENQELIEDLVAQNQARLLALESNQNIVEIVDPCGNNVGYFDEVLLKLQDGTYVAYFESNGDRFLTILEDGFYRTTDNQNCRFEIRNGDLI